GWDDKSLHFMFYNGLKEEIKTELNRMEKTNTLTGIIANATSAYYRLREQRSEQQMRQRYYQKPQYQRPQQFQRRIPEVYSNDGPEPMDLDATKFRKLTEKEKKERREKGLCMYCGKKGHYAGKCPSRKNKYNNNNNNNNFKKTNTAAVSSKDKGKGKAKNNNTTSAPINVEKYLTLDEEEAQWVENQYEPKNL